MIKKINKKGFTLTEILATIAILGIIVAIAVPSYNALSKKFEREYYKSLEGSILSAAKSYYKDNQESKPEELLYSDVVTFSELKNNKNIDDIKAYKSEDDLKGRIIIVKKVNSYDYKICYLASSTTDESEGTTPLDDTSLKTLNIDGTTNKNNCDSNWFDNTAGTFETTFNFKETLNNKEEAYLYYAEKNNQEEIKGKVGITKTLSKKSSSNSEETLDSISLDNETFYPININAIYLPSAKDEDKELKLEYKPHGEKETSTFKTLHIVRYDAPVVKVEEEDQNAGSTLPYNTEITFSITEGDKGKETNLGSNSKNRQYYENILCAGSWSNWQEIGATKSYTKENTNCNESSIKVKYRWIDSQKNISRETKTPFTINLIEENPKLDVELKKSDGSNYELGDWSNKDIYATLTSSGTTKNVNFYARKENGTDTKIETKKKEKTTATSETYKITEETKNSKYIFSLKDDNNEIIKNGDKAVEVEKTVKIDKTAPVIEAILTDAGYDKMYDSQTNITMSWTNKTIWFNAFIKDDISGIENVTFKTSDNKTKNIHWISEPDEYKDFSTGSILTSSITKRYQEYAKNGYTRYILSFTEDMEDEITITATDEAGNVSTKKIKIKLDKTPPTAPSIYFFGLTTDKFYVISGEDNLSGVSENQYKKPNSNDWKTYSNLIHLTAESGTYYAKSIDRAGNESPVTSKEYKKETTESKYTINFNNNGGSGTMDPMKNISRTSSVKLTKNKFTKSGYNFMGWAISKDSSTVTYHDEQEVANITSANSITLYAVWKKGLVATFNYNKATWAKNTTVSCNLYNGATSCKVTAPEIPNVPGTNRRDQSTDPNTRKKGNHAYSTLFTVVGWSTNYSATTAQYKARDTITLTANTTYYAIVKMNQPRLKAFPNEDYGLYCRKSAGLPYAAKNFQGMIITNSGTAAGYNSTNWQYTGGKMWFVGNVDPSNLCSGGSLGVGTKCTNCWVPGDWVDW